VAWISIGEAASALVTDVEGVHQLMASGVLSYLHGSDRRVMLDPDEVRAVLLGASTSAAYPTPPPAQGETGPVSTADPGNPGHPDPERSAEEILAGEGDVVERGKLAARVILALEDEIDALTDLVRDAAVELTKRGATSPEIAHELGISSAAVVRLLTGLPVMGDDLPRAVPLEGETITVPVAERWTAPGPQHHDDVGVLVGVGAPDATDEPSEGDQPVGGNWELWRPEDEFVSGDERETADRAPGADGAPAVPGPSLGDDQPDRDDRVEAVAEMLADDALPTEAPPRRVEPSGATDLPGGASDDETSPDLEDFLGLDEPALAAQDARGAAQGEPDEPAVHLGSTPVDAALARGCLGVLLAPLRLVPLPEVLRRLFRR
jgi:hypothetical protein